MAAAMAEDAEPGLGTPAALPVRLMAPLHVPIRAVVRPPAVRYACLKPWNYCDVMIYTIVGILAIIILVLILLRLV